MSPTIGCKGFPDTKIKQSRDLNIRKDRERSEREKLAQEFIGNGGSTGTGFHRLLVKNGLYSEISWAKEKINYYLEID